MNETDCRLSTLISPRAYVSASAKIMSGSIVEPMAVVSSLSRIETGCFICAGAVVSHNCVCHEGVQVDSNATIPPYSDVPAKTKVNCGNVFR